jgi:hypothetical protein
VKDSNPEVSKSVPFHHALFPISHEKNMMEKRISSMLNQSLSQHQIGTKRSEETLE